jgi:TM2 domain-containing membrane protein YozV
MKKLIFLFAGLFMVVASNFANENYRLNDESVNDMFNQATEISLTDMVANVDVANTNMAQFSSTEDNKAIIATAICFFVGEFGIHRHYLGTNKLMFAYYILTCGGIFGLVPCVDFWVLLIDGVVNKNIAAYSNNDKFFMWL